MSNSAQIFCTLDDLITDLESPGGDVTRMMQAIKDASDYLQKEIGWFIPVTQTVKRNGLGDTKLFLPALLAATAIVNDDDTLVANVDYLLRPDPPHWMNGPYTWLEVGPDATLLSGWYEAENGVQVTGRWGLYEKSVALTATVADTAQQSDSQGTLKVNDGSQVSPGMVLLLGSEQELVTGYGSPTASVTALNGLVDANTEEITVDDASLINVGEVFRVDFEQFKCRDRNTTTEKVHVYRGWNKTNRVQHLDNAAVDAYRTFNVDRACNGTTAAAHLINAAISRYDPPDDVRFLAREIATLMLNKAKSGYAGKSGNEQTGTTFYNDAFPRFDIDRVKEAYYLP